MVKWILIVIVMILTTAPSVLTAYDILLKNGKIITVKSYWERNGEIAYQRFGTTVYIDKNEIEKIINQGENTFVPEKSESMGDEKQGLAEYQDDEEISLAELYDRAIELFNSEKYENTIGFLSMCIDGGHNLVNSYLYRGAAFFQLAQKLDESDETRLEMGEYAKSDLDKSISMNEQTGLAYINRAKVKWFLLSDSDDSVQEDLNKVINDGYPLLGMAYYWKSIQAKSLQKPVEANKLMNKSANLGYSEAVQILFDNPLWPRK